MRTTDTGIRLEPEPTYHEPSFRSWPPKIVTGPDGERLKATLCEELVDGRWEPFMSFRRLIPGR
jgi:hypothetical protein